MTCFTLLRRSLPLMWPLEAHAAEELRAQATVPSTCKGLVGDCLERLDGFSSPRLVLSSSEQGGPPMKTNDSFPATAILASVVAVFAVCGVQAVAQQVPSTAQSTGVPVLPATPNTNSSALASRGKAPTTSRVKGAVCCGVTDSVVGAVGGAVTTRSLAGAGGGALGGAAVGAARGALDPNGAGAECCGQIQRVAGGKTE